MLRSLLPLLLALAPFAPAAPQRNKPPVPDLTAGGETDGKHDWNLGPTGARGWMWGWSRETLDARQILVTDVAPGSPADGKLEVGDVILGVDGALFDADPRRVLGDAITAAEGKRGKGELDLVRWRDGKRRSITLTLERLGDYADTAPYDCPKSSRILDAACEHIAANMKGDIDGMMNALALLATGDRRYRGAVKTLAREVAQPDRGLTLEGRTSGLFAWKWGYRLVFLAEYRMATGDREVMPAILTLANTIARGQSGVGTWGHGMAWPDLNGGEIHGRLGGYGALNQSGLVCHLGLVLAQMCGVKDPEVERAVERANRFASFYVNKGAIPYGDHRPGAHVHDDNGKNSLAALIFDLQGLEDEARFFAKMTIASYGERERGHTGNYFSYLWGPIGAARAGDEAATAFLAEQRWFYELGRAHDGSFPYQGGAGMAGAEHKYGGWDCTGAIVLANTFPRRELYMTGRAVDPENRIEGDELVAAIEAGRGFDNWNLGKEHYDALEDKALLEGLTSWSPAVRTRCADALARRKGDQHVARLRRMLESDDRSTRYGACQALGALGGRSAPAVEQLTAALDSDDVWMRIQACYALAGVGQPARSAAPRMLRLALEDDPNDPREFTQRYLAFCLFYPGGALKMRGLLGRGVEGIDDELLLPAIDRLLQNDDGRARAAVGTVYKHMDFDRLVPILPRIVESIRTPSPSGVMFANGIRLAGLELLARHRVADAMELCVDVTEIDQWGKQDRVLKAMKAVALYGAEGKPVLPKLLDLKARLEAHRESKNLGKQIEAVEQAIATIESSAPGEPVRTSQEILEERGR